MRKVLVATVIGIAALQPVIAQSSPSMAQPIASATRSRDINGFALGMHISEVRRRMAIGHIAGETFSGSHQGVEYEFGFTPLGRIFRIHSIQRLGRFQPDAEFVRSLGSRLAQKYGPPQTNQLPGGPASWELIEPVRHASGSSQPFRTMWFNAMLSNDESGMLLDMTMLDFRILWADQAGINRSPRDQATRAIRF